MIELTDQELDDEFNQGARIAEPVWPPWYSPPENLKKYFENKKAAFELPVEILHEIISLAFEKIGAQFENYQQRKSQIEMSQQILENMLKENVMVYEAGTGVGKSFAYLAAMTAWSYLTGAIALVTTDTRNLQTQLFEKDLPQIKKILAEDITYDIALGSSNYLCRIRYEDTLDQGNFREIIDDELLDKFKDFAKDAFAGRVQGNIFEPDFHVSYDFWSQVNRDSDGCPGMKCSAYNECNYYRTRNNWASTRLLVGNHHLLLYHFINDKKILPGYQALVLDEAHGFLETAFSTFSLSYSRESMTEENKKYLNLKLSSEDLGNEKAEEISDLWARARQKWDVFFSRWEVELDLSFEDSKMQMVTRDPGIAAGSLTEDLNLLHDEMQSLIEVTEDSALLNKMRAIDKYLVRTAEFSKQFTKFDLEKNIYWGEKYQGLLRLNTCNLELSEILAQMMQEPLLFTSATLGYWPHKTRPRTKKECITKGYFDNFIQDAVAAERKPDLRSGIFSSPFEYHKKTVIYIPENMPEPVYDADQIEYEENLFDEIKSLVELSRGGALVLFTSYYMLNKMTDLLREEVDYDVISQAELGAGRALEAFKKDPHAILMGTSSFWQGVDITGNQLRMLIITKLRFTPPDDPIFQGRSAVLKRQGKKPFNELALPFSSMMLKQAFGRLIRSETDTGVVALLDSRILNRSYGANLMANLPSSPVAVNQTQLVETIADRNLLNYET